jgi:hypothetical protein
VNWDEAGLGQQQVNYTLSADATAIYACINGGGNHPKATNKQTVAGQVNNGATFAPENGRVKESLTAGPLSGQLCLPERTEACSGEGHLLEHRPHGHDQTTWLLTRPTFAGRSCQRCSPAEEE